MINALKLTKLDANGQPLVDIHFTEQEVISCDVRSLQASRIDRSQSGAPTLFTLGDDWAEISVQFRIHSDDTLNKLNTVRLAVRSGSLFRIHPGLIDEPELFYDCFVQPNWPIRQFAAGRHRSNERLTLVFVQATMSSQTAFGYGFYV